MPRSRMIRPEFFDDEKLATISRDARLLFPGLWIYADDYGVVKGNPKWLMVKIFPYDDIKLNTFQTWLKELESISAILPFKANGESYYYIRTFQHYQTINKPSQTRNPTPPDTLLHQCNTTTTLLPSETETETETETPKPKSQKTIKPNPTTLPPDFTISEEVKSWALKNGHTNLEQHLEAFVDTARAKGYTYVDWNSAFKKAIRENWGKINGTIQNQRHPPKPQTRLEQLESMVYMSYEQGEELARLRAGQIK